MPSSEQMRERKRLAWEWAYSFALGQVEVLMDNKWIPCVVKEIDESMGWPIVRAYSISKQRFLEFWYSDRKSIRKQEAP